MTISENKKFLRQFFLENRAETSREKRYYIDQGITSNILSSEIFQRAKAVFTYCSTDEEINTRVIMRACLSANKVLCLPRCEKQRGIMTARCITSESDIQTGKFGVLEPSKEAMILPAEKIDLCIVPCLAADKNGFRLGYGGGYYDRFLEKIHCPTIVLCAESRVLPEIPHDTFDIPCTMICTERRILICETFKT